ncbi:cobalamin biosynthesis protein [Sphaerisporangium sp. B11E5]|uniref:cobalamin biosynthesis protein n=1 Tax=Sphaerisporangium sp. B11E5 TaxID=3153563 RepID=UPI00325E5CAE
MISGRTFVRGLGILLGVVADAVFGDPEGAGHPVAVFGRFAGWVEKRVYGRARGRGVVHVVVCVGVAGGVGVVAERVTRGSVVGRTAVTAVATWAVLGGSSLVREGLFMARFLEGGDLEGARGRLPHLCGRDPSGLGRKGVGASWRMSGTGGGCWVLGVQASDAGGGRWTVDGGRWTLRCRVLVVDVGPEGGGCWGFGGLAWLGGDQRGVVGGGDYIRCGEECGYGGGLPVVGAAWGSGGAVQGAEHVA